MFERYERYVEGIGQKIWRPFIYFFGGEEDNGFDYKENDAGDECAEASPKSHQFSRRLYGKDDTEGFVYGFGAILLTGANAICSAPCLVLSDTIFREFQFHLANSRDEFQVMGLVGRNEKNNQFRIIEWVFPPHHAGMAHADIDQDQFPAWLDMLEAAGKDIGLLRIQAHSHGRLEAYFSSTDVATIREAYSCDWMISIVGNQRGTMFARLDVFRPVPLSIGLPIIVESPQLKFSTEEVQLWRAKFGTVNIAQHISEEEVRDGEFHETA